MNKYELTVEELLSDAEFINYCLDDVSSPENKWKIHLKNNPAHTAIIEEARQCVMLMTGRIPNEVVEVKLSNFKKLFYKTREKTTATHSLKTYRLKQFYRIAIAASFLLLGGYLLFWPDLVQREFTFATLSGHVIKSFPETRKTILLEDGTEAIIYPGSSITVSDDFNEKDRKIAVRGQVYLRIFHQIEKPFIAYSKHTTTTALGTAFYVRDFVQGEQSSVLLIKGRVKVEQPKTHARQFLDPGTSFLVDNKTLKISKTILNQKEITELAQYKLYFENADMGTVIQKLELYYGIEIDTNHCYCEFKRITGDYSNQSLINVLTTISYINQISWELSARKVVFKAISNRK